MPQIGAGTDIDEDISAWISAKPMTTLISVFGGDPRLLTASMDVSNRLAWLDTFTDQWEKAARTDPETGKLLERNEAKEISLTEQQTELVLAAADALGLREVARPKHASYDYVLILGGLLRACICRPAYAAELIQAGVITARSVVALGGHRPFGGDEFSLAEAVGLSDVREEYEALDKGTRLAFGLTEPDSEVGEESDLPGGTWGVRRYQSAAGLQIAVTAAPSSEPRKRRANTPDAYQWFAERFAALKPGQRVLAVTTPINVPTQHAAALRMLTLPYGVEVETIGYNPDLLPPALLQVFSPTKYLLEVRTAVRSIRQLHDALQEPTRLG